MKVTQEDRKAVAETKRLYAEYETYQRELILVATRIPKPLHQRLKFKALTSTLQILMEHAYRCYLGSRVSPEYLGPFKWPEPALTPELEQLLVGQITSFGVRMPRRLISEARCWAVTAGLTDQEFATKVLLWYAGVDLAPPEKAKVRRDSFGNLLTEERLVANDVRWSVSTPSHLEEFEFYEHRMELAKSGWTWAEERREILRPSFQPTSEGSKTGRASSRRRKFS